MLTSRLVIITLSTNVSIKITINRKMKLSNENRGTFTTTECLVIITKYVNITMCVQVTLHGASVRAPMQQTVSNR